MPILPPVNPPPAWETEGTWRIVISPAFNTPEVRNFLLTKLPEQLQATPHLLPPGRHALKRMPIPHSGQTLDAVVKSYGVQAGWRDALAIRYGAKAGRAFAAATCLRQAGVGTPEPIAALERWEGRHLKESHFVSQYVDGLTDLRDELNRLFCEDPLCSTIMDLLQTAADAIRAMHEAGLIHCDLGNQNIALRRASPHDPWQVLFLDLNRAHHGTQSPTLAERGQDIARLDIPSDFLRVFKAMYFHGKPPPLEFDRAEKKERAAFIRHSKTRALRHPIRQWKIWKAERQQSKPLTRRELWVWDDRSAQAISLYTRKDRHKLLSSHNTFQTAKTLLLHTPTVLRHYRQLQEETFQQPVDFTQRIGLTLEPDTSTWDAQLQYLEQLQSPPDAHSSIGNSIPPLPIQLRLYHHQTRPHWEWTLQQADFLHQKGHPIAIALVQDRNAIRQPDRWSAMLYIAIQSGHPYVDTFEIGHAVNRSKWGIWDYREYLQLLAPCRDLKKQYPNIRLTGPAGIYFVHHILAALLAQQPADIPFHALSHHLYVDRRGAPENRQGPFDLAGKIALTRALARSFPHATADRLIISEVNWPIRGTGVWSPVNSPYEVDAPRTNDPSVTEEQYAAYMARYILLALASGHVERLYWWRLMARGFGLIDDTHPNSPRLRPAFHTLRQLLHTVGTSTYQQKLPTDPDAVSLQFHHPSGPHIEARWTLDTAPVFHHEETGG